MKFLKTYSDLGLLDENDVFNYFIETLRGTNRTFDYFVDWGKIFHNIENIEVELNILNYLIGKNDIRNEFKKLISKYPEVVNIIPILIAVREKTLEVLVNFKSPEWEYKTFSFRKRSQYSPQEAADIVEFCDSLGLLDLFKSKKIKNLVDYCIGLEVGIGTNARKNRSGHIMEDIIEWHINQLCTRLQLEYICQATTKKILSQWNIDLPRDKSSRQYDFAILTNKRQLVLIETNFYSGGGSKLKSVAGEFQSLDVFLKDYEQIKGFVWITDGAGWHTAKLPLKEAHVNNDYIINTRMIFDGVLEEIVNS